MTVGYLLKINQLIVTFL